MRIVMFALLAALAFSSCKKDEGKEPAQKDCTVTRMMDYFTGEPTVFVYKNGKVWQQRLADGQYLQHNYDSQGRPSGYNFYDQSGTQQGYVQYVYDANGRWIERNIFGDDGAGSFTQSTRMEMVYTGDRITRYNDYKLSTSTTEINAYGTLTYDANGNVSQTEYFERDGSNNLVKKSLVVYEYDDKKHFLPYEFSQYFLQPQRNNVVQRSITTYTPTTTTVVDSTEYLYNADGYPARSLTTTLGTNTVEGSLYEYECE